MMLTAANRDDGERQETASQSAAKGTDGQCRRRHSAQHPTAVQTNEAIISSCSRTGDSEYRSSKSLRTTEVKAPFL